MRADFRIPPTPDRLRAPAYTDDAIRARETFVRTAADAWRRAGQPDTADRLSSAADALARRRS